ncbi:MAG TPA: hypothetical protein VN829_13920 [Dongiaceae bacterium]|nr:hypothetical protein SBA4_4520018 [Candidatus Sulfopaludibacter sp. SbA4]HXP61589.1 hypothetical protein [Dongiaceae bacterium]
MMSALTETATAIGDKVSEVKETVEDIARSAGKKLDEARDETADRLHTAASSVRTTGRHGSEAIDRIAKGTAKKLDSAAEYVEECDFRGVLISLRQFSRRHLTGSLLAAAAIGFLAGSALRRTSHARSRAAVS